MLQHFNMLLLLLDLVVSHSDALNQVVVGLLSLVQYGIATLKLKTEKQVWHQTPSTGLRHLSSTTDVFSYTIASRKLSANKQFFVGAQTVVRLLQKTQIISDACFITDHVAYASSKNPKIIWIEMELFFLPRVDASHVYVGAWVLGCFHSLISTKTFRTALTASVDSCAEIKSAPSVA